MTVGIFNSSQITTDLAAKSFAATITRLMPNGQAPLFGMTAMLPSETALQVEHGFFTKTMLFPAVQLSVAAITADTVLTVVSSADVLPGMLMRAESTGEVVIINSILSATQVSVTRGIGSTAGAIAINVRMYQIGNAFEESSVRPNALQINPVRITNLTQIFRNTWALSGSAQATQVIAGDTTVAENRMDCAAFHAADMEKALFFGTKSQGTRNGQPFRTMDGLRNIILNPAFYPPSYAGVVNNTTAGGTTNFTQLENALDPVFNQATDPKIGNERVLFVGGQARKVLNNIGRVNGTYFIQNGQTNYGLQFGSFNIARGSFRMIEHPLFNSNADWSKYAIAVDLSTFRVAYLGGRKTMKQEFNMDGKAVDNGIDAVGGTLTTEMTCVVKNPPANAIITNLTAAAVG
jgi:hypothetical protein